MIDERECRACNCTESFRCVVCPVACRWVDYDLCDGCTEVLPETAPPPRLITIGSRR